MPDLRSLIPAHREIADRIRTLFPEESEADLADTIEGASDLPDAIFRVLRTAIEREANGKALAEIIDTMVSRRRRLDEGARTLRTEALRAMEVAGLKKLAAPDMSISVGVTRPKVLIIDDTAVPDDLCKITRAPSRAEIAKALAEGRDVPGVMLGNPETHLTIHRR